PPSCKALALCQGHCDEARRSAALHPHQDTVLVVGARGIERFAHVTCVGDSLAADLENDVAFLEATLGRRALRVDLGNDDAFLAGTGDAVGRRDDQAQLRYVGAARDRATLIAIVLVGLGLHLIRQLAERAVHLAVLALLSPGGRA